MSYATIRNQKYKQNQLGCVYRHNERKNKTYSNKEIHKEKSKENYSLKSCDTTYAGKIKELIKEYNLQGRIMKSTNIICELIISSSKEYFDSIGEKETRRFFETAYEFVSNYKNLGESFIVSAIVHMDENTPHMHLVFVPVVHKKDEKSGKEIHKIACSEFWNGRDSYHRLQDSYYRYMTERGFELERGTNNYKHIPIKELKKLTNYEVREMFKNTKYLEKEIVTDDIILLRENYKRVVRRFNTLVNRYERVKYVVEDTMYKAERIQDNNIKLKSEVQKTVKENNYLKMYISKTFECVSILFDFPIDSLKKVVREFVNKINR